MRAPPAISIFLAPEIKLYYNQGITCVRLVTKRRDALGGSLGSVVDRVLICGPDGCHHLLVRSDIVSRLLVLWTRVGNREGARATEGGGHRNREKRARARDTYIKREAEQEITVSNILEQDQLKHSPSSTITPLQTAASESRVETRVFILFSIFPFSFRIAAPKICFQVAAPQIKFVRPLFAGFSFQATGRFSMS